MARDARLPAHVQAYLGFALYERIVREAAARGLSVSQCVRADLEEIYALRDAAAHRTGNGTDATGTLSVVIAEVENRLAEPLADLPEMALRLRRIEAMLDRHYAGMMVHVDDPAAGDEDARLAAAVKRYDAWRRSVVEMLAADDGDE